MSGDGWQIRGHFRTPPDGTQMWVAPAARRVEPRLLAPRPRRAGRARRVRGLALAAVCLIVAAVLTVQVAVQHYPPGAFPVRWVAALALGLLGVFIADRVHVVAGRERKR